MRNALARHPRLALFILTTAFLVPKVAEASLWDFLFGSRPLDTLNQAVAELGDQPAKWQGVLEGAISSMERSANKTVVHTREELEILLKSAQQGFHQTVQCEQDVIGKRVLLGVQEIRFGMTGREEHRPRPTPLVCSVLQPTPVNYAALPGALEFLGFNFKRYQDRGLKLEATLAYEDHTAVAELPVAVESDYKASIQVQSLGTARPCLDPARGPRLVLRWNGPNGGVERSEIPVTAGCGDYCGAKTVTVDKLYDNVTLMSGSLVCSSGWRHGYEKVVNTCVTDVAPRDRETVGYSGSCVADQQPTTEISTDSGKVRVIGTCAEVAAQLGRTCP